MENKKKNGIYVLFAIIGVAVLVGLDQWTKSLAVRHLAGQESITLIPGVFQLQYLENRGAGQSDRPDPSGLCGGLLLFFADRFPHF